MTFPPGQTPPGQTDPNATPVNTAPITTPDDQDESISDPAPGSATVPKDAFMKVQMEAKNHRLRYNKERDEKAALLAENAQLKAAEEARKVAELESQKKFEDLYKAEQAKNLEIQQKLQARTVEISLESQLAAKNINPKLLGLVNRNGIAIDAAGNATGIKEAVDRFIHENPDLVTPAGTAAAAAPAATTPPADPNAKPNPADNMMYGATGKTYAEMAKLNSLASGGKDPAAAAGAAQPAKVDVSKMSKKEYDAYKKGYIAKLPNR